MGCGGESARGIGYSVSRACQEGVGEGDRRHLYDRDEHKANLPKTELT